MAMSLNRLGVHNKYNSSVRIDNWNEEQFLLEARMKDYMLRKAGAASGSNPAAPSDFASLSLQNVELTSSADGCVHFGDSVMLLSINNQALVCSDITEKLNLEEETYASSTSASTKSSTARNVFIIEDPQKGAASNGNPVLFGQPIRIRAHPILNPTALYLHSRLFSKSKYSKRQAVSFAASSSFDVVWVCQLKEPSLRFEAEGSPVPANSEIILYHSASNVALASDKTAYFNRFGSEFELFASSTGSNSRPQVLQRERTVGRTVDQLLKVEDASHHFAFITASNAGGSSPAAAAASTGGN